MNQFDAYHKWLGIPPAEQPPNHYRLLGITRYESNQDVIRNAADQRMRYLKTYGAGQHSELSQQLLNEVSAAKVCLLEKAKKREYDAWLRQCETPKNPVQKPPISVGPLQRGPQIDPAGPKPLPASQRTRHGLRKTAPSRGFETVIPVAVPVLCFFILAFVIVLLIQYTSKGPSSAEPPSSGSGDQSVATIPIRLTDVPSFLTVLIDGQEVGRGEHSSLPFGQHQLEVKHGEHVIEAREVVLKDSKERSIRCAFEEPLRIDDDFDDRNLTLNVSGTGSGWSSAFFGAPRGTEVDSDFRFDGRNLNDWNLYEISSRDDFDPMAASAMVIQFRSGNVRITHDDPEDYDWRHQFAVVSSNEPKSNCRNGPPNNEVYLHNNTEGGLFVTIQYDAGTTHPTAGGKISIATKEKVAEQHELGCLQLVDFTFDAYDGKNQLITTILLGQHGWSVGFSEGFTVAANEEANEGIQICDDVIAGSWDMSNLSSGLQISDEFDNGAFVMVMAQNMNKGRGIGDVGRVCVASLSPPELIVSDGDKTARRNADSGNGPAEDGRPRKDGYRLEGTYPPNAKCDKETGRIVLDPTMEDVGRYNIVLVGPGSTGDTKSAETIEVSPDFVLQGDHFDVTVDNAVNRRVTFPLRVSALNRSYETGVFSDIMAAVREKHKARKLDLRGKGTEHGGYVGLLTELKSLDWSDHGAEFFVPQIGYLKKLEELDFSGNGLGEDGEKNNHLVHIGHLRQLKVMDLSNNRLSSLPVHIGWLRQLKCLCLNNNRLSSLPVEIAWLTELQYLYLRHNNITALPKRITRCTKLKVLDLRDNPLSDEGKRWLMSTLPSHAKEVRVLTD